MTTELIKHPKGKEWLELNPLARFITYENDKMIIFEFPRSVSIDFYGGAKSYFKYFNEIKVDTWWNGFAAQAEKITAYKKVKFTLRIEESKKQIDNPYIKLLK